jgi:YVTN family beta-propeller protein
VTACRILPAVVVGFLGAILAAGSLAGMSVSTVELPGRPFGVAVSADQRSVFVSLSGRTDGIAVLAEEPGGLRLRSVASAGFPLFGIALSPDGRLIAAAAQDHVGFFDARRLEAGESDALLGMISDGRGAGSIAVAITADGRTLFVSDERAAVVTVVDLDRLRTQGFKRDATIGRIPVGRAPVALLLSGDGQTLYATSEVAPDSWGWPRHPPDNRPDGAVVIIDAVRARTAPAAAVVARVPAGSQPVRLALSPAGDRLYVTARGDNAVLVFDTARLRGDPANSRLASIPVGPAPVPIVLVDDGRLAFVGNSDRFAGRGNSRSTLSVIDTAKIGRPGNPVVASVPCGAFPREFCLSPDGRTLYLTNFLSGSLQVMRFTTAAP